jgi:hypothetical protein
MSFGVSFNVRHTQSEQRGAGFDKPHIGPALVPCQPAFGDRTVETGPVLVGAVASLQKRRVDQLDVDAARLSTEKPS